MSKSLLKKKTKNTKKQKPKKHKTNKKKQPKEGHVNNIFNDFTFWWSLSPLLYIPHKKHICQTMLTVHLFHSVSSGIGTSNLSQNY